MRTPIRRRIKLAGNKKAGMEARQKANIVNEAATRRHDDTATQRSADAETRGEREGGGKGGGGKGRGGEREWGRKGVEDRSIHPFSPSPHRPIAASPRRRVTASPRRHVAFAFCFLPFAFCFGICA